VDKEKWVYLSILFYGGEGLHIDLNCFSFVRNNIAVSQNLEETSFGYERLKYDYKNDFACLVKRSGRCRKPWNLNNSVRNVTSLSNAKRDFSSMKSYEFKKLSKCSNKHFNLIEVLADVDFLQEAYKNLNAQNAFGTNDLDYNWFCRTSKKLLDGSFQFQPARRVLISNSKKFEENHVILIGSSERVVQKAMQMILETIYERKFLETSHGFRPSKGCHSALEMIQLNWSGVSWFLNFDVEKCYTNINQHRLVNILKEDVKDQRFLDLVTKMFNAGFFGSSQYLDSELLKTTSQESTISNIFVNIYLHKLDLEIVKIMKEYQNSEKRYNLKDLPNTELEYRKQDFLLVSEHQPEIIFKHKAERRKLERKLSYGIDSNFTRIRYVRYDNKFLLGVAGSKESAVKIRNRIVTFGKSDLKLTFNDKAMTHIGSGNVKFLGMVISSEFSKKFEINLNKAKRVKNVTKLQKAEIAVQKSKIQKMILRKVFKSDSKTTDMLSAKHIMVAFKKWINLNPNFSKKFSNSYRQFFEAVLKKTDLVPDKLKENLEASNRAIDKWLDDLKVYGKGFTKHYKKTSGRFHAIPLKILAPLVDIKIKLREKGVISKLNKPKAVSDLIKWSDYKIVNWYRAVGRGLLSYYSCCQNFHKVKSYVDYMVRWSAIHTLAGKHKSSCKIIIDKYSKDLVFKDKDGLIIASFLSSQEIKTIAIHFRRNVLHNIVEKVLKKTLS
jgi:hypothetical protein